MSGWTDSIVTFQNKLATILQFRRAGRSLLRGITTARLVFRRLSLAIENLNLYCNLSRSTHRTNLWANHSRSDRRVLHMQTYCFPRMWHQIIPEPKAQIRKARLWSIILGRRLPPMFLVSFWGRRLLIIMVTWWYVCYAILSGWHLMVDIDFVFIMLDNKPSYRRSMHTYL